jgi:hypothetical protein
MRELRRMAGPVGSVKAAGAVGGRAAMLCNLHRGSGASGDLRGPVGST